MTRDDIMAVQRLLRALGRDVAVDGICGAETRTALREAHRAATAVPEDDAMRTSDAGVAFIKDFEALRTSAYLDAVGVPTIGYGHTKGVRMGQTITAAEAEALLREDLAEFEGAINRLVLVPMKQAEFDALVSFAFNVGSGAFEKSTLRRKLNSGDYLGAANEFLRWDKAGGRTLAGLTRRRKAERAMFLDVPTPAA